MNRYIKCINDGHVIASDNIDGWCFSDNTKMEELKKGNIYIITKETSNGVYVINEFGREYEYLKERFLEVTVKERRNMKLKRFFL